MSSIVWHTRGRFALETPIGVKVLTWGSALVQSSCHWRNLITTLTARVFEYSRVRVSMLHGTHGFRTHLSLRILVICFI